jgi:hypothetical protein
MQNLGLCSAPLIVRGSISCQSCCDMGPRFFRSHSKVCCFTSRSKFFHLYGDVTITGEGLQKLGLSAGRDLYVSHLLWHGTLVFPVSSEGPGLIRRTISFCRLLWHARGCEESILTWILTNPHPKDRPISRLLWHTRGCGRSILTRILAGLLRTNPWSLITESKIISNRPLLSESVASTI